MFKTARNTALTVTTAIFMTLSFSACNQVTVSDFLSKVDVSVAPSTTSSDDVITLSAQFKIGNVNLAQISVPIPDPRTSQNIGTATFAQLGNGQAEITVSVNSSVIPNASATLGNSLPNNNPTPLALGTKPGDLLAIPFMTHSRLYIGGDLKTTVYMGVALGINGLDQVMSQIGSPANLFYSGTFGQVMGVGGLYGSPTAYENGIAIFAKYTMKGAQMAEQSVDPAAEQADQQTEKFNARTQRRLNRFFSDEEREIQVY